MQVSVVIPVFESAATLRSLVADVVAAMQREAADYELVLVNDGSSDSSWQVIRELARQNPRIMPIDLSRNYGEHNATLCGIRAANFPITVTLDDDRQFPPAEIALLLSKLAEGYDVVYGSPRKEQHGLPRDIASQLTKLMIKKAMGVDIARNISSFRAFRTRLRDGFRSFEGEYPNIDVLLTWSAATYSVVKVEHLPRTVGRSTYNLERLVRHAMNMITGFSMVPLQLATIGGAACMLSGFLLISYTMAQWIARATIAFDVSFLAGVIMIILSSFFIALGIIGEYLGRMYAWSMRKPSYSIKTWGLNQDRSPTPTTLHSELSAGSRTPLETAGARD